MKKLIFGIIATVMLSNVSSAQSAQRVRLKESSVCVSLLIITYCASWSYDKEIPQQAELADRFSATKPQATVNEKTATVTISGFGSEFEGKVLNGPRAEFKSGKFTKEGQYVVKRGQIIVPIENK